MQDLRRYRSETPPVTGLASITHDDRGVEQSPADGDRAAWKSWVSASKTRNWLRRDPLRLRLVVDPAYSRRLRIAFVGLLVAHWAWQCYYLTR